MTSGQQAGASGASGVEGIGSGSLSPEQIEERLCAQREALAASVDEFASRIDPRTQAKEAGEHLREQASAKADHLREQAAAGAGRLREQAEAGAGRLREGARRWVEQVEETWERAKQGDSEASSRLAKAAAVAGGAVTVGIVLSRLARRRHRTARRGRTIGLADRTPKVQPSTRAVRPRLAAAPRRTLAPRASRSASGTAMSAGNALLLQVTAFNPQ